MIDVKKIKELIKLMEENDLSELDLQSEGESVRLKRGGLSQVPVVFQSSPAGPLPSDASNSADTPAPYSGATITSPMVGTFYAAPSPDADPFINVGDRIDADTVVCVIEAMKVFNEIKAEVSGVVEQILVENGAAVEFGQSLFVVKEG